MPEQSGVSATLATALQIMRLRVKPQWEGGCPAWLSNHYRLPGSGLSITITNCTDDSNFYF